MVTSPFPAALPTALFTPSVALVVEAVGIPGESVLWRVLVAVQADLVVVVVPAQPTLNSCPSYPAKLSSMWLVVVERQLPRRQVEIMVESRPLPAARTSSKNGHDQQLLSSLVLLVVQLVLLVPRGPLVVLVVLLALLVLEQLDRSTRRLVLVSLVVLVVLLVQTARPLAFRRDRTRP